MSTEQTSEIERVAGLDVSRWQGDVNWTAVAAGGARFAFAKATEGSDFVDLQFAKNWVEMKTAGLVRGAYHYYRPASDPVAQARHFLSTVPFEPGDLPLVLDLEAPPTGATLVQDVKTWLDVVQDAIGCAPMIYVSPAYWNVHMKDPSGAYPRWARNYPLWVASYNSEPNLTLPSGWRAWTFWQYTGSGKTAGVTGKVDLDWCQDLASVAPIKRTRR